MESVVITEKKPRGLKKDQITYKRTFRDNEYLINKYVFHVYNKDLHIIGYSSNKRVGEMYIANYKSASVYDLMRVASDNNPATIARNRPLYDGLLQVYHDTGGDVGLTVPTLREAK